MQTPTIFIPSPYVAEDHQTKNAMALVEKDAAIMIADNEIDKKLFPEAFSLVKNKELSMLMSANIKTLAKPEATKHIVDEIEKIMRK